MDDGWWQIPMIMMKMKMVKFWTRDDEWWVMVYDLIDTKDKFKSISFENILPSAKICIENYIDHLKK